MRADHLSFPKPFEELDDETFLDYVAYLIENGETPSKQDAGRLRAIAEAIRERDLNEMLNHEN